ncbi:MAG TPA: glycosyltransferase [Acidobacteriaceae bacterium]|nr:glycosyltransferase [Acidobacteriaceae bacterium]
MISCHTNLPVHVHYYRLGFPEKAIWRLMRVRHGFAEANLCTSTATMGDLHSRGVDRLALWERAVDAQGFHPSKRSTEMRRRLSGGETEKPLLLHMGRLSAKKDVAILRTALEAVVPGARLAIVGDGPTRRELERHFSGTAAYFAEYSDGEELAAAYASADLFLMPSRTETPGLVILEAMASGCPVVECRAGGVSDAVEDGVTGFLYEPTAPDGLADALKARTGLSRETGGDPGKSERGCGAAKLAERDGATPRALPAGDRGRAASAGEGAAARSGASGQELRAGGAAKSAAVSSAASRPDRGIWGGRRRSRW